MAKKLGAIDRAVSALATAGGVAHVAFFTSYAWKTIRGAGVTRYVAGVCALVAALGVVLNFAGWALVKHGGRFKAKKLGYGAIGLSSALAGGLLAVSGFLGDA